MSPATLPRPDFNIHRDIPDYLILVGKMPKAVKT